MQLRPDELRDLASRQVEDVHDLIDLLEIDVDMLLHRFTDLLYEHQHKFGVADSPTGE